MLVLLLVFKKCRYLASSIGATRPTWAGAVVPQECIVLACLPCKARFAVTTDVACYSLMVCRVDFSFACMVSHTCASSTRTLTNSLLCGAVVYVLSWMHDSHRCCSEEGLQRSVAVEVKSVATDAGRARFVQLLR